MDRSIGKEEKLVGLCHNNKDINHVAKGKCPMKQRPLSPCVVAATTMTSRCSFSSPTTPFESVGKEEEDMANCLILLAQGKREGNEEGGSGSNKNITWTTTLAATTNITTTTAATIEIARKNGSYNYECKTCNKIFSSFQALGGHRASHKKLEMNLEEKKSLLPSSLSLFSPISFEFEESKQIDFKNNSQIPISLHQLGCGKNNFFHGNKSKIHECYICGAKFTSGQALGGHMRKHRTSKNPSTHVVNNSGSDTSFEAYATNNTLEIKPCNVLKIDLNLPALEEDWMKG
ncbi:hypothetical protein Lal_00010017 [Lupinus albus]|uniref:Putative transcription factor C2H2 family n=1 Tax=Lupinus albus TaxID=3870 RepID=A0A6A4N2F2_LUPAL|nr:putative transcription factor C2H2 family [Lupinus albus]KAF1859433.1 hypothetical protein Lal_00010017 [Lupinus albus]